MDGARTVKARGGASWRLTFVVWSLAAACWALVTATADRTSLTFIRRLIGDHDGIAAGVVAAVIALPLIVDAWRFLPKYRRLWLARSRSTNRDVRWSHTVPVQTPRVFRADGAELTWRERSIVEQGQYAIGQVVHHGGLTSVHFETSWGSTIASRPMRHRGERPREGAPLPLVYEPGAHVGVAPSVLGLSFPEPLVVDERTPLEAAAITAPASALTAPLLATLHPVERMSRYLDASIGEIAVGGDRMALQVGELTTVVPLDKPLSVQVSAFLLPDGRAEVNVEVATSSDGAYRAHRTDAVRFKTEIAQARLGTALELGWSDAPYVSARDFDHLWRILVSHAGQELSTSVAV